MPAGEEHWERRMSVRAELLAEHERRKTRPPQPEWDFPYDSSAMHCCLGWRFNEDPWQWQTRRTCPDDCPHEHHTWAGEIAFA